MAYDQKITGADTPIGTMRLAGRDQQDSKTAVAAPSATGGAPKMVSEVDRVTQSISDNPEPMTVGQRYNYRQGGANFYERPVTGGPAPPYRGGMPPKDDITMQRPVYPQPILPKLRQQPIHDPDRYSATNPELVQQTESFIQDLMNSGHSFDGFSGPGEVAKYLHAAIYSEFEPHLRAPMPLADLVHQTREGRSISEFIRNGQANRVRFGGRAL